MCSSNDRTPARGRTASRALKADTRMQTKHVVTVFLLHESPEGDRILLVRRSGQVGTYQGKWAGISGYIEPGVSPEQQARTELREEAALGPEDVSLVEAGIPLHAPDPAVDTDWVVHPFLFAVKDPGKVRTDWEATEARWIPIESIVEFETVPKLQEALSAVYPLELAVQVRGQALDDKIRRIVEDREHGATTIAKEATKVLAEVALAATRLEDLERACILVANARPLMATIRNVALSVLGAARASKDRDPLAAGLRSANRIISNLDYAVEGVAQFSRSYLRGTVVTISASSTVLRGMGASKDLLTRVIVAEGRPLLEGRRLAQDLRAHDIPVDVITEAEIPLAMAEANAAVIGADCFLADGSAVNKTGSRLLALAARERNIPFVVLADTLKLCPWIPETVPAEAWEHGSAADVWPEAPEGVRVRNTPFELVPAEYITRYVTEDGIRRPDQVAALARSGEKLWAALAQEQRK